MHKAPSTPKWGCEHVAPIRAKYRITNLDKDYQWAVIGHPSRKLAWVLSRAPVIDESTYRGILTRLEKQGYDPAKLALVPQRTN